MLRSQDSGDAMRVINLDFALKGLHPLAQGEALCLVNSYFHHALKGLHRATSNPFHNIQFHTYLFVIRFGCLVLKMTWRIFWLKIVA